MMVVVTVVTAAAAATTTTDLDRMDLQWFASAEDEGRTFEPTDLTYRKAREEGRVAKSQDLIGALGLLLPALAIVFLAPGMLRSCVELLRFFLTRATAEILNRGTAVVVFRYFVRLALPVLAVAVATALFSNMIQTGLLFTTKPLTPDFSKIVPRFGKYFERTLGSVEGLMNFGKSVAKMVVIGAAAYAIITSNLRELANLQKADVFTALSFVAGLAARLLLIAGLLLVALSIPDYLFQRWQFRESLKMNKQQFKEEMKQEEGDPQVRSRLRARYRDLLSREMLAKVPEADVVITNPTHYSVALRYDQATMEAPMVTAKGEDALALRIREIAAHAGVPVVAHPPLTRAIYHDTEVGETVPVRYWRVLGILLRHFWKFDRARAGAAT